MNKHIKTAELLKNFRTSDFFLNCNLPIEYTDDFPIMHIENETLCMTIPYLKYKLTGQRDKTLVYPIRYTVTITLPEQKVIAFEDLQYNKMFSELNFDKPIGLFRHEEIKHLTRSEYKKAREQLYEMYDKMIETILYGEAYTQEDEVAFTNLIKLMLEPSQYPVYKAINKDFFEKYIG